MVSWLSWGKSFVLAASPWGQPTPLLHASQLKTSPCRAGALRSRGKVVSCFTVVLCLGATDCAELEEVSAEPRKRSLVQGEIVEE